jgi:hypothetical protein
VGCHVDAPIPNALQLVARARRACEVAGRLGEFSKRLRLPAVKVGASHVKPCSHGQITRLLLSRFPLVVVRNSRGGRCCNLVAIDRTLNSLGFEELFTSVIDEEKQFRARAR